MGLDERLAELRKRAGFLFIIALLLYVVGAVALAVVALAGIAIGAVMAPFLYPFAIRARLTNLREGNTDDIEVLEDIAA